MSLTSILEAHTSQNTSLSTPTKQKRSRYPQGEQSKTPKPATPKASSTTDIWKWVFSSEAIAPCFVRDVFEMRHHQDKDEEYYWIGNVPCRTVKIVGLTVGVQRLDKKVVYTIDDGTGVVDCIHKVHQNTESKKVKATVPMFELPKPVANIGASLRIIGRIQEHYESRQIIVESIEKCASANEEPLHWRAVHGLHETRYSSTTPFVVPEPVPTPNATTLQNPAPESATPSTFMSSSPSSSIATSSAAPSPTKSASSQRSPNKLRHPSRLHSRDLTDNTFRIYLKHYMDNPPSISDETESSEDDGYGPASSPTKRQRTPFNKAVSSRHNADPEETPRPSRAIFVSKSQLTPRAKMINTMNPPLRGFTLSYLRRVPELSDMARRVCKAEAKRRERDARRRAKEAASSSKSQNRSRSQVSQVKSSSSSSTPVLDKENSTSARMKRLFKWAILQLVSEGSVVVWSGPTFPCSVILEDGSKSLWKHSVSSSSANTTANSDVSLFSTASSRSETTDEEEEIEISDPESNEEAYISLFPEYLAVEVETAIRAMTAAAARSGSRSRSALKMTKEGILTYLQRDDRWRRVGEWSVEEALEYLKDDGRAVVDRGVWRLLS